MNDILLNINEIFYSIQGEGSRIGKPCIFVRLQGCNLKCKWCDTKYAQELNIGTDLSIENIIAHVKQYNTKFVEITGGEPLIQKNVNSLFKKLLDLGYEVACETSGSIDISHYERRVIKIMDIKCPSTEMESKNLYYNTMSLTKKDEIKFVIADKKDFNFALEILTKYKLNDIVGHIFFSPAFGILEPSLLAEWILNARIDVRLGFQLHKYIWNPNERAR